MRVIVEVGPCGMTAATGHTQPRTPMTVMGTGRERRRPTFVLRHDGEEVLASDASRSPLSVTRKSDSDLAPHHQHRGRFTLSLELKLPPLQSTFGQPGCPCRGERDKDLAGTTN